MRAAVYVLFYLSLAWIALNMLVLMASFAGEVPFYFWSVVAAVLICVASWRWLKLPR